MVGLLDRDAPARIR